MRSGLDRAELSRAGSNKGFPQNRDAFDVRRDLFRQFEPLPADRIFEVGEARNISSGPGQIADITGADRVSDQREHDRNGAALLQQGRNGRAGMSQDDVGRTGGQLRGVLAHDIGVARAPAIIDPDVLADGPTGPLRPCAQRDALRFGSRSPGAERPCICAQHAACRAAAEKRDEISSFHVSPDQGIAGAQICSQYGNRLGRRHPITARTKRPGRRRLISNHKTIVSFDRAGAPRHLSSRLR